MIAFSRLRGRGLPRTLPAAVLLCAWLAAWPAVACSGRSGWDERIEAFRATHTPCESRHYRKPCQIGPDGRLYEYEPGER